MKKKLTLLLFGLLIAVGWTNVMAQEQPSVSPAQRFTLSVVDNQSVYDVANEENSYTNILQLSQSTSPFKLTADLLFEGDNYIYLHRVDNLGGDVECARINLNAQLVPSASGVIGAIDFYNDFDYNGRGRSYIGDNTIYYAYVDLSRDPVFNNYNNTQINEENNKKCLEERVSSLNSTISNLNNQNWRSNNKISTLTSENRKLRENQEKIKRELTEKNDKLQRNLNGLESKYNDLEYNHQTKINNLNNENKKLRKKKTFK